jgi:hypothetical protein
MRSTRGLFASIVFLLALPVAALYQMLLATGVEAVLHGALALGALLMAFAVFDFKAPRWAAWVAAGSTGLLAGIFLLQGVSELVHDESLTSLAYQSMFESTRRASRDSVEAEVASRRGGAEVQ